MCFTGIKSAGLIYYFDSSLAIDTNLAFSNYAYKLIPDVGLKDPLDIPNSLEGYKLFRKIDYLRLVSLSLDTFFTFIISFIDTNFIIPTLSSFILRN